MKMINRISFVFLLLLGAAFAKTGIEALLNPQAVLANVGINLDNTSALSSMRAVYGGMHLVFGLFCLYGAFKAKKEALGLTALYATGFIIGRLTSFAADGAPNEFVSTWLFTEIFSAAASVVLIFLLNKKVYTQKVVAAQV